MLDTLLGNKKQMGQTFIQGTRVPVTWVKAGPCVVTQVKKEDTDGYWAVQLGFGEKRIKNVTQSLKGHLRAAYKDKKTAARFLREVRLAEKPKFKVGDVFSVSDIFKKGDVVSVTAISKGKGFAGVVKRWGFAGGPRTHGQSDRLRAPGSIGQGTSPGRVHKGKKMPGRMGTNRVTIKNLTVVNVDSEAGELAVSGPIPGFLGSLLIIQKLASGKLENLVKEAPQVQVRPKYIVKEHEKTVEEKPAAEGTEKPTETQKKEDESTGGQGITEVQNK